MVLHLADDVAHEPAAEATDPGPRVPHHRLGDGQLVEPGRRVTAPARLGSDDPMLTD